MQTKNLLATLFLLSAWGVAANATSIGPCHPYPGAVAQDCLELVGQYLNNEDSAACSNGLAILSLRNCDIVTVCPSGAATATIDNDTAVRRAWTTMGSCALNDHGSISGYYIGDDNVKTCYLYPGSQ